MGLFEEQLTKTVLTNPRDAIEKVVVHPLVLLSVVDHFNRMAKVGNQKRVVGVLLGSLRNKVLDIANSFAGLLFLLFLFYYTHTHAHAQVYIYIYIYIYIYMQIYSSVQKFPASDISYFNLFKKRLMVYNRYEVL